MNTVGTQRLQKIIAQAGYGSRRNCEEIIKEGRISVNGEPAVIGQKADPELDAIFVDGKKIVLPKKKVYIAFYKPEGYITTMSDPQGRPKVSDLVKLPGIRLFPVGRLDQDTSGLLLMTNDGEFTYLLTHPKHEVWKTYQVLVAGKPSATTFQALRKGILLSDGKTAPAKVKILCNDLGKTLLEVKLREGRKRQVKRMFKAVGHRVLQLKRTQMAFLKLNNLTPGQYRYLSEKEVTQLKKIAQAGITLNREKININRKQ